MDNTYLLALIFGLNQFGFIFVRTHNVKAVAAGHIPHALLSGTFTYLAWIVGIAIGSVSMYDLITDFKLENLIVIASGLVAGLLGTYLAMIKKKSKPT